MGARGVTASVAAGLVAVGLVAVAPGASAVSTPVGAPTAAVAGDAVPRAKVPVSVTVNDGGRVLVVRVDWNDGLDDRPGRDRFAVRVMAGTREVALRTWRGSRPDVQTVTIRLTASEAKAFTKARSAGDAVVAVSQQSDTNTDDDTLYERNTATIVRVPAADSRSYRDDVNNYLGREYRNCSDVVYKPGERFLANWSNCDLAGISWPDIEMGGALLIASNMTGMDLTGANLRSASLSSADMTGARLNRADLTSARMSGVVLNRADLTGAKLNNAELDRVAILLGTNLTGADLSGVDLSSALMYSAFLDCGTGGVLGTGIQALSPPSLPPGWTLDPDRRTLTAPIVPCG